MMINRDERDAPSRVDVRTHLQTPNECVIHSRAWRVRMVSRTLQVGIVLLAVLPFGALCQAQSTNLLRNPDATHSVASWRSFGEATIELTADGNQCFVVRNGGYFFQDVELPDGSVGLYAVLIGQGSSERINAGGIITDLPYLYGYMMEKGRRDGKEIHAYLQGQKMLGRSEIKDQWVQMSGVFKVPEGTNTIRFFLNQALHRDLAHNGSAARFDNLGLYLFATKQEAELFVAQNH